MKKVVTRFAPSPTGFLHIGGIRTALFSYLFAKHNGGKFLLRIEDTDNKRLIEESVASIKDGLRWVDLENDGFSMQSENLETYIKYAAKLLISGKAYFCSCSESELEEERKKSGPGYKYSGKCKKKENIYEHKTEEELFLELKAIYSNHDECKKNPVIRFDSSFFEKIEFDDMISSHAVYLKDNLDDFIIMKNTGIATFMFAVVVDDILSGVTHIIRGNDHHTNSAKHLMIYDALDAQRPQYAHLPLIMSEDGTKMSKRKNATDVMEYKKIGFLPHALLNYLLLLGFSPENNKEILTKKEMIDEFEISRVHNSPARFDMQKLQKINQHYLMCEPHENLMKILNEEKFFLSCIENSENYKFSDNTILWIKNSLSEVCKRIHLLSEILPNSTFYLENWNDHSHDDVLSFLKEKINSEAINTDMIRFIKAEIIELKDQWTKDNIEKLIGNCANEFALKKGEMMKIFRAIFTGVFNSYSIIFILYILEQDEALQRINSFQLKYNLDDDLGV